MMDAGEVGRSGTSTWIGPFAGVRQRVHDIGLCRDSLSEDKMGFATGMMRTGKCQNVRIAYDGV